MDVVGMRARASEGGSIVRFPARLTSDGSGWLRRAAGALMFRRVDLVHRLDLRVPPPRGPEVVTVHDLAPKRYPDEGKIPPDAVSSARRARAVICPSNFAAKELADQFGVERLEVVYNGVDEELLSPDSSQADGTREEFLSDVGISKPFVLHVGGCTVRKNLGALAGAWVRIAPSYPEVSIVMCGPADERRTRLFSRLPRVHLTGWLPRPSVVSLMRSADAIVVPSVYEGFGLPAVEGMACGVPVVASRRSSLPEVCGSGALLVEPTSVGIAGGLEAALRGGREIADMVERGVRRARQFTWERSVSEHLEIYERLIG